MRGGRSPRVNETLGLVAKTIAVAFGCFGLLLGLLAIVVGPRLLGVGLTLVSLAILVPVFGFAMRDALREAREQRGE